jgi:hypothetical protein
MSWLHIAIGLFSAWLLYKIIEFTIGIFAPARWVGKYYFMQAVRNEGVALADIPEQLVANALDLAEIEAFDHRRNKLPRRDFIYQLIVLGRITGRGLTGKPFGTMTEGATWHSLQRMHDPMH